MSFYPRLSSSNVPSVHLSHHRYHLRSVSTIFRWKCLSIRINKPYGQTLWKKSRHRLTRTKIETRSKRKKERRIRIVDRKWRFEVRFRHWFSRLEFALSTEKKKKETRRNSLAPKEARYNTSDQQLNGMKISLYITKNHRSSKNLHIHGHGEIRQG